MSGSLLIRSRVHDYQVTFEPDLGFLDGLAALPHSVLLADAKVFGLYQAQLEQRFPASRRLLLTATEEGKTLEGAQAVYDFACAQSAKKNLRLLVLGGGILQDVGGFAASTLYRGIEWHYVPTTLLAQADSCIGGKTSLNFRGFKNLLGTFYPPRRVHIHTGFLASLDRRDLHSGLGEIIKLQLMKEDGQDLEALRRRLNAAWDDPAVLQELIRGSLAVKVGYMEGDEFDQGRRNLLNFGHCFGHALESATHYGVPHGIAVNVGMVFAQHLAAIRGEQRPETAARLIEQFHKPFLGMDLPASAFEREALLMAMQNDKKRTGTHLAVVVPDEQRHFKKLDDVTQQEFDGALIATQASILTGGGESA